MPSLSYYLHRTREQSFRETLNLAQQLFAERLRAVIQPAYDQLFRSRPDRDWILERTGFANWAQLTEHLKSRVEPAFIGLQEPETSPDALLNQPLHWHTDPVSGYTWNSRLHYRRIRLLPRPGVDIKNPWNLSRFHEAVVLGEAYRSTSDEKYAKEFVRRVLDWIERNPYRHGVNWTSAMEAGIRAVNWCCAFDAMRQARAVDEHFVAEFVSSLWCHAEFIKSNLERREVWIRRKRVALNSNHYICDLVGLLFIAVIFPELRLDKDRQFAISELEKELFAQTHWDGGDYENSTTYHRFVWDIFMAAAALMRVNEDEFSTEVQGHIAHMKRLLRMCTHPDGSLPQLGDNDGGTFLPTDRAEIFPYSESECLPETRLYSMRGEDSHVVVCAWTVGMHGFGSHSHNDLLSFEYWYAGQTWIVDPGTYVYLPDPEARNWFRSTEAHNTVRVDGKEINPFHKESIFQMVKVARGFVDEWIPGEKFDELQLRHNGYHRLPQQVTHTRRFEFEKGSARLEITDTLEATGVHLLEWFFQLHPAVRAERNGGEFLLTNGTRRMKVRIVGARISTDLEKSWYSPTYGVRQPSQRIVGRIHAAELPQTVTTVIEPC